MLDHCGHWIGWPASAILARRGEKSRGMPGPAKHVMSHAPEFLLTGCAVFQATRSSIFLIGQSMRLAK